MIHVFKKLTFKYSGYIMAANTNNGKCYEMILELGEGSQVPSSLLPPSPPSKQQLQGWDLPSCSGEPQLSAPLPSQAWGSWVAPSSLRSTFWKWRCNLLLAPAQTSQF